MAAEDRPARAEDVDVLAAALPHTSLGITWGDRPTWLVGRRGFLLYRMPHKSAINPATGEPWTDLLVIWTASLGDKEVLVADPSTPFFTVDHFDRHPAVLLSLSQVGQLSFAELREVITDAWLSRATKTMQKQFLSDESPASLD